MMAGSAEEAYQDSIQSESSKPYVSCIRIYGRPILPPLMTADRREEMQHYKGLAELVEVKLKKKKTFIGRSLLPAEGSALNGTSALSVESQVAKESTTPVQVDTALKCVDTQEILEEFDPLASSSCSAENSGIKRQSGSTDEFSTSKTGSSDDSVAMTNSTDLYHYMDVTGSSLGDGRSTRRSLTPVPGSDWNSSPHKSSGDQEIKATYDGLNEYLDSILISSASSPPSCTKRSDEEVTPTNGRLCENLQSICLEDDTRAKSCPLSPIPHESLPHLPGNIEKLVDIIGESTEAVDKERPRLVRSNSYTLDAPSPMLLAHLEAEKKKNDPWNVKKTEVKKPIANTVTKVLGVEKRSAGVAFKSHLSECRVTHSPPKKAKSPATTTHAASNAPKVDPKPKKDFIGQPEVRKLFADLQAKHNRQMEELLRRQRLEEEMIREALLEQKVPTQGLQTWANYFRTNTTGKQVVYCPSTTSGSVVSPSRDCRKSLSSSFILSQVADGNRNLTVSAPPGTPTLTESPKRPSSSPALTSFSGASATPVVNGTDTNGNLTSHHQDAPLIPLLLPEPAKSESASTDIERVLVNEASPKTRRRAWADRQAVPQDPDWLQLSQQRQMHWAASKIQAGVRGYLTRRLLRTERVQGCITVIQDTILCALELQRECAGNIEPSDLQLHGRLIHQLSDACREVHSIFMEISVAKRMAIIALDRERLETRSPRSNGPRPLSRATQIALTRKMAQNNSTSGGTTVSTTRRKNWANNIKGKISTQGSCEIVASCLSRSATTSNSDSQRSVSASGGGGGPRKPWR